MTVPHQKPGDSCTHASQDRAAAVTERTTLDDTGAEDLSRRASRAAMLSCQLSELRLIAGDAREIKDTLEGEELIGDEEPIELAEWTETEEVPADQATLESPAVLVDAVFSAFGCCVPSSEHGERWLMVDG